jgi:hypothetical protein
VRVRLAAPWTLPVDPGAVEDGDHAAAPAGPVRQPRPAPMAALPGPLQPLWALAVAITEDAAELAASRAAGSSPRTCGTAPPKEACALP